MDSTIERTGGAPLVAGAWAACLLMLTLATSVVGLFAAPVAVPAAVYGATRRHLSWAVRVPLLLGALALTLLGVAWLADGAGTGTTVYDVDSG